MHIVNLVVGRAVDLVLWPFRGLSPWFGLVVVSLLTALLMLEVYKLTSNQAAIRRAKDRIKAHLLEMRLYKDNMRVTLGAQAGILKSNLAYMAANLKPLAVMIVPLVLILARLSLWFDRAPLRPGEETLVKVELAASADPLSPGLRLTLPPGDEGTAPAKTDYEGRTYFFCSNSCKQDFLENPDRYLEGEEEMWALSQGRHRFRRERAGRGPGRQSRACPVHGAPECRRHAQSGERDLERPDQGRGPEIRGAGLLRRRSR